MDRKYVRKWWLLKRSRIICPEVAVNDQFLPEIFENLPGKIDFFTRIHDLPRFQTRLTPLDILSTNAVLNLNLLGLLSVFKYIILADLGPFRTFSRAALDTPVHPCMLESSAVHSDSLSGLSDWPTSNSVCKVQFVPSQQTLKSYQRVRQLIRNLLHLRQIESDSRLHQ